MNDEIPAVLALTFGRYLSDDYCARCDSYGHIEHRDTGLWCNVCWKPARPLPRSLHRLLERYRRAQELQP